MEEENTTVERERILRRIEKKRKKKREKKTEKNAKKNAKSKGKMKVQSGKKHWPKKKFHHDLTKLPVVAYGTGMKNKDQIKPKGHRVGLTGSFYRQLKKRQKDGDLLVAEVDEYFTSRAGTCHSCMEGSLTEAFIGFISIRACTDCGMLWNRDTNSSKNIHYITYKALHQQDRPPIFCHQ